MRISKWVDFGQEVDVNIDANDIRGAMSEAFANVTQDRLGEERPNRNDVLTALNNIAAFLKALTDEHIAALTLPQRTTIEKFLTDQAKRYHAVPLLEAVPNA